MYWQEDLLTEIIRGDEYGTYGAAGLMLAGGLMFAWFRRIRRVNIFGFELEFNHPPEAIDDPYNATREGSSRARRAPGGAVSPPNKQKTVPPGARFTVYGTVMRTVGKDLGIRARNEAELREFWRANEVDTDLDWFGPGAPVCSIGRARDIAECRDGDEASLTLEVVDRAGGKRGTRTVDFEVLHRPRTGAS